MEENKVIELQPLGKWKRILLFLGDYFITFIFAFTLFNIALFPLSKVVFNTEEKYKEASSYERQAYGLLANHGIIYLEPNSSDFNSHINYTFKVFLSYYAFDSESPSEANPDYGHKEAHEVIKTYYVSIKREEATYLSIFKDVNVDGLFDIGETISSIKLKDEYKKLLSTELLEVTDESKYSENMLNFRDHVFARLFYLNVYKDITDNDFVRDGVSYNECLKKFSDINKSLEWVASGAALVSVILGWGIYFLVYPLINSEHRTMTMSIMKLNRLKLKGLRSVDRSNVLFVSFYNLILCLSFSVFMPSLFFGVAYSFNLPMLFILSIISFVSILSSLVVLLANQYNRSGSDLLTYTVIVPTSEIDALYNGEKQ